jgi:septal ring factor EnvC (AmiA/AmiB activator)
LRFRALVAMAAALPVVLAAPVPHPGHDAHKTEAELQAIKAEIERVAGQVSHDQLERDRLARELRTAEMSASGVREILDRVRRERTERAERRASLAAEKQQRQTDLVHERVSLGGQLRAAYLIGSEEPLKLLLNQQDPARAGRMFVYYSYFGRARADQIAQIGVNLQRIDQLDEQVAAEDRKLADLEAQRRTELARLDDARAQRSHVLASLQTESRSHAQSLQRLRQQQSGLERLLRELKRAMDKFPLDSKDAFARLRGKLTWPVTGRVVAHFGEARAGGVKWDGVLVATERGAPVHAVYQGRVVYADWLPGLGLLTIIDHGEGYLSLYGHNDRLYKAAGERVDAGDTIAAAGDSGGRNRPELYFEIRKAGHPVDPRAWFKAADPSG